jgi:hypothetical protein
MGRPSAVLAASPVLSLGVVAHHDQSVVDEGDEDPGHGVLAAAEVGGRLRHRPARAEGDEQLPLLPGQPHVPLAAGEARHRPGPQVHRGHDPQDGLDGEDVGPGLGQDGVGREGDHRAHGVVFVGHEVPAPGAEG